jgi:two-component system sensor histidine kinase DesK
MEVSEEAMEALAAGSEREAAIALALREAVTNVLRHAGARRCRVAITRVDRGRHVRLTVEDDGRGGGEDGGGLDGMHRRIEALGGSVRRHSQPPSGKGTVLTVELPAGPPGEPEAAPGEPRPATSPAPA